LFAGVAVDGERVLSSKLLKQIGDGNAEVGAAVLDKFIAMTHAIFTWTTGSAYNAVGGNSVVFNVTTASTPFPAALPLFATGLGALGVLGWRRKRKQVA